MNKSVAVILVNYNGKQDTIECIESIMNSCTDAVISIIVVDNRSKENDLEAIQQAYNNVICIQSEENLGFAGGNNLGIVYALDHDFDYILLLNNDTIIADDMIDLLLSKCDEKTITTPTMLYYSEPEIIWYAGGRINRFTGNAEHYGMGNKVLENQSDKECTFATGCCIMLSREVIECVGLLSEDYFMYCEDTDYCIRLVMNNFRILYIPNAKLWHKIGRSSGGNESAFSTYYITRNRLNYLKKYSSYFYPSAYPYSLFSRYLRKWKSNNREIKEAYTRAIADYRAGKVGR